jgi:hypothetical protein
MAQSESESDQVKERKRLHKQGIEDWKNAIVDATGGHRSGLIPDVAGIVVQYMDVQPLRPAVAVTFELTKVLPDAWGPPTIKRTYELQLAVQSDCSAHGKWCGLCRPSVVRCADFQQNSATGEWVPVAMLMADVCNFPGGLQSTICLSGKVKFYNPNNGGKMELGHDCRPLYSLSHDNHWVINNIKSRAPIPELRPALEAIALHCDAWWSRKPDD